MVYCVDMLTCAIYSLSPEIDSPAIKKSPHDKHCSGVGAERVRLKPNISFYFFFFFSRAARLSSRLFIFASSAAAMAFFALSTMSLRSSVSFPASS